MSPLHVLAAVLVALVPFNVAVTMFLFRLLGNHDLPTLRSRAYTQVILLTMSLIGATFGASFLTGFTLGAPEFTILLAVLVLLPSIPGAWWTLTYVRDGFE